MDFNNFAQYLNSLYETYRKDWKYFNDSSINSIEEVTKAIKEKEITEEVAISNTDDITRDIIEAQNLTTQAIKEIKEVTIPEADYTSLEGKLEAVVYAIEKQNLVVNQGDVNVDLKPLLKAIEKLPKKFPEMEKQEVIDYTLMFDDLMKIMEKPDHGEMIKLQGLVKKLGTSEDLSAIAEWLKIISEKESPEFPELKFKEGRLLVAVDKVGGGGGGLTQIESESLQAGATEATLKALQGFQIPTHDSLEINYTDTTKTVITTIVYKLAGVTVSTKTFNLAGATKDIISI